VAIVEGPLTCHITGTLAGAQIEHLLRASKPRNVLGRMHESHQKRESAQCFGRRIRRKPRGGRWPRPFLGPLRAGHRGRRRAAGWGL